MIFSRRIKRHDLYRIVPAPAIIAGRGEMVRLRSGRLDWTVQVGYAPPLTESGVRRHAQEKSIRMTLEFLRKNIVEAKQRSTPILGLDLNSGLGLKGASEQVEEPFVGEIHRSEQKLEGHEMGNLLRNTDSTSIATVFPESGPTYFSPQGTSRTLDHWVGPVGLHHIVEDCRVLWKTERRSQLFPAGLPRDHMPILLTLRYALQLQRREASTARAEIRWDQQAIADWLQKGDKRV